MVAVLVAVLDCTQCLEHGEQPLQFRQGAVKCASTGGGAGHKSSVLKENSDSNGGVGVAEAKMAVSTGIPNRRCLDTRSTSEILLERNKQQGYFEHTT